MYLVGTASNISFTLLLSHIPSPRAGCADTVLIEQQACVGPSPPDLCVYGPWTNFGPCSLPCGGGTQMQTRQVTDGVNCLGQQTNTILCNTQPCVSARRLRGT